MPVARNLSTIVVLVLGALVSSLCAQDSSRTNQGIYGAEINQLAFDSQTGVLFAATQSAQSLFASTDSGKTWYQGFPTDSLLYDKGGQTVGWGGAGMQIVSDGGITAVYTREDGGDLWGAQMSTDGGVSWQAIVDAVLLEELQSDLESDNVVQSSRNLTLTYLDVKDGTIYMGFGNIVLFSSDNGENWDGIAYPDSASVYSETNPDQISVFKQIVPIGGSTSNFLCIVGTGETGTDNPRLLYRTSDGGGSYAEITIYDTTGGANGEIDTFPMPIAGIDNIYGNPSAAIIDTVENYLDTSAVAMDEWEKMSDDDMFTALDTFSNQDSVHVETSIDTAIIVEWVNNGRLVEYLESVHVIGATGDTIIAKEAASNMGNDQGIESIHRSYDGGASWTRVIRENPGDNLGEVYVFENGANGVRLVSASKYSDDLGESWVTLFADNPFSVQMHIPGTDIYIGPSNAGPYVSENGIEGDFTLNTEGLEAVTIYSVAQLPGDLDRVFLGTYSGIAVTTAYTDTAVDYADKWSGSNGAFPLLDQPYKLVAINPYNSDNVWALNGNGMWSTTTGGMTDQAWDGQFNFGTAMGGIFTSNVTDFDFETFNQDGGEPTDIAFYSEDTILVSTACARSVYGGVIRSNDGGSTWAMVTGLPDTCCNTIKVVSDAAGNKVILAGFGAWGSNGGGWIMKSDDAGESWTRIETPDDPDEDYPLVVYDILVPTGQTDTMYFAAGRYAAYTFNGGDTITVVEQKNMSVSTGMNVNSIAMHKSDPDSLFFSQAKYVWALDMAGVKAGTAGAEMKMYYTGLPGENIYKLHFDALTMTSSLGFFEISSNAGSITGGISHYSPAPVQRARLQVKHVPNSRIALVTCELPQASQATIDVFGTNGRKVSHVFAGKLSAGTSTIPMSTEGLGMGFYMVRLSSGQMRISRKVFVSR